MILFRHGINNHKKITILTKISISKINLKSEFGKDIHLDSLDVVELNDEKIILFIEMSYSHKKYDKNYIKNKLKFGTYSIDKYTIPDEIIFGKLPRILRQEKIDKNKLREYYKNLY